MRWILTAASLAGLLPIACDAREFLRAGYILNHDGTKCSYMQSTDQDGTYFHDGLLATTGHIVFDDPQCMSWTEDWQKHINLTMINNVVGRWYGRGDADYGTSPDELRQHSSLQKKGQCVQSKRYPALGFVVDVELGNSAVVGVWHASAVNGCKPQ